MKYISNIPAFVLGVLFILSFAVAPQVTHAQSAENDCEVPNFEITSSDSVLGIAGENFSYFVVTSTSVSYQLDSSLPAGLSYSDGQISGIPSLQAVGDHTVEFSATNDCGTTTDSISITILNSDGSTTSDDDQEAAAGTVGLNEIPETGIVADTALTVGFYLLALLLIAVFFSTQLRFSLIGRREDLDDMSVIPSLESRYTDFVTRRKRSESRGSQRRFGDGIRR
ncbi:MAG: putative Ig domain-containing protein [Candidatus Paceibacterota bacterium]